MLSHVIEHIDDSDKLLQEAKEFADTLCIEVPDFTADPLNWVSLKHGYQFYADGDHVREYTLETLQNNWKKTVGKFCITKRITAQWSLSPLRAKNKFFRFL